MGDIVTFPQAWTDLISNSPPGLIRYFQTLQGIGLGRRLSMPLVETKYALVSDDDFLITKKTNISLLLDVLENTDVSLAGGFQGGYVWEGALRIVDIDSKPNLVLYPYVFYEHLSRWNCYATSTSKNIFLAKVYDIMAAGSWNAEKVYFEHEDFM